MMTTSDEDVGSEPGRRTPIHGLADPMTDLGAGLGGRRVLVVEDDDAAREALEILLSEEGLEICACACAKDALAQLSAFEPDLLLTDLRLPDLDGASLARRARESQPGLPVLLMSGVDETDERIANALREPHTAHLVKPLALGRLMAGLGPLLRGAPCEAATIER